MKTTRLILAILLPLMLFSCVSRKKYKTLNSEYSQLQGTEKNCEDQMKQAKELSDKLSADNKNLQSQVDYLKKNSNQVLGALQDMSVLSAKQAESIKQSMENLNQKDAYIKNLQSAIARKDSINMLLVTHLKSNLADVNDQDVNIKVDKGVVYIDISDKLLFNTGQYQVTEKAKKVLGKVAKVLEAYPDMQFMVEGHTDNVPIHTGCLEDNWDLSVKRATSVVRILEKQYKVDPARMTAAGHSRFVPVGSNDNAEGRALNRRTRIIILPQLDQFFKLITK